MTISFETSRKISRLQWICCLLVVLQHSVPTPYTSLSHRLVAGCLTRIAVPFFFVISGLLFFKSFSLTKTWAWHQIIKRVRTLLIPYLFFNFVGIVVFVASCGVMGHSLSCRGWLKFLLLDGIPNCTGHLWYIGMLFKMSVISLPLGFLLLHGGILFPIVLLIVYFCGIAPIYSSSLFFFSIGGLWAFKYDDYQRGYDKMRMLLPVAIGVAISAAVLHLRFPQLLSLSCFVIVYPLAMVLVAWFAYDLYEESILGTIIDKVAPTSFFVYCVHPYFYWVPITNFAVRFIVLLLCSLMVYGLMKKVSPRFLSIACGGRS